MNTDDNAVRANYSGWACRIQNTAALVGLVLLVSFACESYAGAANRIPQMLLVELGSVEGFGFKAASLTTEG